MLKFLGILFLFIYVIRPLIKLLFKGYMFNQFQKFERQAMKNQQKEKTAKEGSIHVDYVPNKKSTPKSSKSSGDDDYVPFEEIK